jgi:hypothetical protein
MVPDSIVAARPRTAGEILDDAWRLSFADAVPLLFLSGALLAPAFAAVLWLLAHPAVDGLVRRWLLCGGVAALASFSGMGSGACQAWIRRRSESRPAGIAACMVAGLRRGSGHVAMRAVVLSGCFVGVFGFVPWLSGANAASASFAALIGSAYLLLPAAVIWMAAAPAHAVLASTERRKGLLSEIGRAARLDPGKTAIVILSRVPLLALACFNLYLLVAISLWAAINLGGFDLTLASASLSLRNPVYDLTLVMACWLMLAPYFEVSNFLLYLDARTRQDGLDLLQRVRRAFPVTGRAGVVLAGVVSFFGAAQVSAADLWPAAVRAARATVEDISAKVATADPYPGSAHWEPRLRAAGARMREAAESRGEQRTATWFEEARSGFARASRAEAIRVLDEMRQRLGLIEETLPVTNDGLADERPQRPKAEIKNLVRHRDGEPGDAPAKDQPRPREEPRRREVERAAPAPPEGPSGDSGGSMKVPSGMGAVGAVLLLGVLLAVIGVAAVRHWTSSPEAPPKPKALPSELPPEDAVRPDEQPSPVLWRQAEDLARTGRHREAVRALYLAVLSLLHAQRLVRYETTRTNGEYVRQIRFAPEAPVGLAEQFERLTNRFEALWYGSGDATAADFQACMSLAEGTRALAHA